MAVMTMAARSIARTAWYVSHLVSIMQYPAGRSSSFRKRCSEKSTLDQGALEKGRRETKLWNIASQSLRSGTAHCQKTWPVRTAGDRSVNAILGLKCLQNIFMLYLQWLQKPNEYVSIVDLKVEMDVPSQLKLFSCEKCQK